MADAVTGHLLSTASGQRRRLAEQIIAQVRSGGTETASLLREAGLPPDGRYLAVAIGGITAEVTEELLAGYTSATLVTPSPGEQVVGFVLSPSDAVPLANWLRHAATAVAAPGTRFTAGVSGPVDGCGSFPAALRDAAIARRLAVLRSPEPARGSPPPVAVATSADADSHELLLASVAAPVLRSFRDRLLGPVAEYDERHHAELVPTLRAFLDCNGSWSACAEKLYVHVNTVRYRIGRIEELTGRDLSSLANRVDFFLALRS